MNEQCSHPLLISAPAVQGPGINIHCRKCRRRLRANVPIWRGHELADRFNRTKRVAERDNSPSPAVDLQPDLFAGAQ